MRGAEIAQQRELADGVPRARGNGARADLLRAVMRAQPAREQPVAVGDVHEGILRDACHREGTGGDLRPDYHVVLRIADDGQFARRARRCVDFHDVAGGSRIKPEGIRRAQIVLDRKGQLA